MLLLLPLMSAHALDTSRPTSDGVGSPSGPTQTADDAVRSLDFLQQDGTWRLVVGVPGAVVPTVSAEEAAVVLHLPGATLPQSLARPLDASHFHSTVTTIQAVAVAGGVEVRVSATAPIQAGLAVVEDGFVWLALDEVVAPEVVEALPVREEPRPDAPSDNPLDTFGPSLPIPSLWK